MKKACTLLSILFTVAISTHGQFQIPEGLNYSQPLQVDSSNLYVFGELVNKATKSKYTSCNTNDVYRIPIGYSGWTNMFVCNTESKQAKKLFSISPVSIYPVSQVYVNNAYYYGSYKPNMTSAILKDFILIAVKTNEFNNDAVIDEEDPIYLFIASKEGSGLTQISPKDMNVTSWTLSKDGKNIIFQAQKDKNNDKKFSGEDEIFYQVDLESDFSKIKVSPIHLLPVH